MALVTVLLCVIFGLILHFTEQRLQHECIQSLHNATKDPGFLADTPAPPSALPYFVMWEDAAGKLQINGTLYFDRYSTKELNRFWELAKSSDGKVYELSGHSLKYLRTEGPMGIRCAFVDTSAQKMVIDSLIRICISVGILSFTLFLALNIWLSWWLVKPVEKAWSQQRQFVADASHELKTPLTVIMTNAELLQNPACAPDQQQQSQNSILTMSRQMRSLVEALLDLARVDNGSVKLSYTQLDLSSLVSESILPFEPVYFEKGLVLTSELESGIQCKGSEPHLRQVLDILLDNGLKYSHPESQVTVRLKRQGLHSLLSVTSIGDPIAPEDQINIFKRFYRIDKARTRTGSYGLGLSIAQSILEEHRGKIWVESDCGRNTFFVQLNMM